MICNEKHIDIPESLWKCPKCGSDEFFVEDTVNPNCGRLHPEDAIYCDNCHTNMTVKKFANILEKAKSIKKCPHCNGAGYVMVT